jgi:Zinc-binding dehydrogenase.
MAAKIRGCSPIIAVDIHDSRLEIAATLGATHTLNSLREDVKDRISGITGGPGLNYTIDTSGVKEVIKTAIRVLGDGGVTVPIVVAKKYQCSYDK